MRYLIISDIHANLESLMVLIENFIPRLDIDKIICLGDIVGYNADPTECISLLLQTLKATTIRGNHDKAVAHNDFKHFSDHAKAAGKWTRNNLSPQYINYLVNLEPGPKIIDDMFAICHGSPLDEDKYILSKYQSIPEFLWLQRMGINLLFFGHTHVAETYMCDKYANIKDPSDIILSNKKKIIIETNKYYCINPGSLGQPRDDNPNPGFALFDTAEMIVEIIRFQYSIKETQKKIIERGVPFGHYLAARLGNGE